MKLADINAIAGVLSGMKINKVADKETKAELGKTYLAVRKALRPFERDRDDLVEKFRSDWHEVINAIVSGGKGGEDFVKANEELNETVRMMLEEGTAEVAFSPVKSDYLYAPELWGENITLGEISEVIAFLVKHGVAEE